MPTELTEVVPPPSAQAVRRLAAGLIHRILTIPFRFFFAPDVFIAYSRKDGSAYAEALANQLVGQRERIQVPHHRESALKVSPGARRWT